NVYSVFFVGVMIVAPIVLGIVAGKINAGVTTEVKERGATLGQLKQLEKTPVDFVSAVGRSRPVKSTILVNQRFLDRYQEVVGIISDDAKRIRQEALNFNRADRDVLFPGLFPEPAPTQLETIPRRMYMALVAAYERLLVDMRAGAPPSAESMGEILEAAEERFRTQILIKPGGQRLTDDDMIWLKEQLTNTRLSHCAETAKGIGIYTTLASLNVPDESLIPPRAEAQGMVQLFQWQWSLWITQDIVGALSGANEPFESVLEAPVKRLVSLVEFGAPVVAGGSAGGGGSGFNAGFAPGGGRGAGSGASTPAGGKAAAPLDPAREVPLDFAFSFTGRKTNPLYDVRLIQLVLIAETARIPVVLDALSRKNFITILDATLEAVDAFEEVGEGYFYGSAGVSKLTLDLETVWLREWTAPLMPPDLKLALGIPVVTQPPKG
ncbi:MAG: hypothetical protein V3W06_04320, partial [Acidimicrobiia bacterium]